MVTGEGRVQLFRLILGLACTLKFVESLRHGGWHRFDRGTFERYRLVSRLPAYQAWLVIRLYRVLLVVRVAAGVLTAAGIGTRAALVVVVAALAVELIYEFRSHTTFLLLCCLVLLTAGSLGHGLTFSHEKTSSNTWAQCLIVLLVTDLYWASAWCKLRSRQFWSGSALTQYLHFMHAVRTRLVYPEARYPGVVVTLLAGGNQESLRRWRILSLLTIVLEILLPLGLLVPATYPFAVVLGMGMHAVFTVLLPRRLAPFSLATVGTYVLFQP